MDIFLVLVFIIFTCCSIGLFLLRYLIRKDIANEIEIREALGMKKWEM